MTTCRGTPTFLHPLRELLYADLLDAPAHRSCPFAVVRKEAVVTERIDNLQSTGTVQINGQVWTARSVNPEHRIEKDEIVMVRAIEGVKLIVGKRIEPADE